MSCQSCRSCSSQICLIRHAGNFAKPLLLFSYVTNNLLNPDAKSHVVLDDVNHDKLTISNLVLSPLVSEHNGLLSF